MDKKSLCKFIDHTLLKPDCSAVEVEELCSEALKYNFASVCVNPSFVSLCSEKLKESGVKVCTVIGFPLGATTIEVKVFEAKNAIDNGATELDMVINISKLKDKDYDYIREEIKSLAQVCKNHASLKVIIETCLLSEEEKLMACRLSKEAGADFVKTSTGFSKSGATVEDIKLMRNTVGDHMGVKASGGIRDTVIALDMIEAGATRIGASASVKIIEGMK
ncbi:deoxyribose-phosphate aldolase [Hathewaya massiliensis]|uniref:deoxyribose-phosphate aldolase n=1 Tax=Hathewaya massiliensis TaxID=1964382 RepID=UPI00115A1EB6|nr:deoxyribose-phosphate aldolase [Hathewaya massiliensis]